jgi:hypothetical protein
MSVSDYIPPWCNIPVLDPEDFEYLDHEPTQEELDEVAVHIAYAPLRRMMVNVIHKFKDSPDELKGYFLHIINSVPDELPALREVLITHFPQHLKFVDQMILLKNDY